ncbi:putative hydro-lyase [Planctobacterium marinum]|uniref:putative hydro-lyase n=1 Tax=Planctobacterium marinum TaxID=1631968 RepID=UPI001E48CAE7|nr:putative hydro-lyase [Planctobacterium marinum]MCC2607439.1 putative hydro-lyase [Planctobacterium marinum]
MLTAQSTPQEIRQAIRKGDYRTHTSGLAKGYVQCNLVILPNQLADEFRQFCQLNPRPCPIIATSQFPGDFRVEQAGNDIDIRTDFPAYQIFKNGKFSEQVPDISSIWQEDFVAFLLGCSFSFEEALLSEGIEVRNISEQKNVPMYKTNIPCKSAGRFSGNMVVSMRPMKAADAIRAIQICSRYPSVHGAPVHFGDPSLIGIKDLSQPDFGDAVTIHDDEVPLFWACGVTPQLAIMNAKPELCITHSPGCMLVTDLKNSDFAIG